MLDVTVVIPSIPPRVGPGGLLDRAVQSALGQTYPATGGFSVALDVNREGAGRTRDRALRGVRSKWCAFLDDDDTWYPHHLETLTRLLEDSGADYAYSWFDGNNPFPMHRGRQMNVLAPHHTTMTVMVRTELAQEAGFVQPDGPMHQDWSGEDWQFTLRCIELGAKFIGTGDITWTYNVHTGNTSGLSNRW